MAKQRRSEKLLLNEITTKAGALQDCQRNLQIGQLVSLIRGQLKMSQRALAVRSGVPQATISKIESGHQQAKMSTLHKVLDAMECDLLVTVVPRDSIEMIRRGQALQKARKKALYIQGTMSLEEQEPTRELLRELIEDEVTRLMESSGLELWGEEL